MSDIGLDKRDRRNLYKEDADNVFTVAVHADDDVPDIEDAYEQATGHLHSTGERRAYIVIRIER